jgi:hypothetical protein
VEQPRLFCRLIFLESQRTMSSSERSNMSASLGTGSAKDKKKKKWSLPKSLLRKKNQGGSASSPHRAASFRSESTNNGESSPATPAGIVISGVPRIEENHRSDVAPRPIRTASTASIGSKKHSRRQTTPSNMLVPMSKGVSHGLLDDAEVSMSYRSIPLLETTKLYRGGITIDTQGVGRVQFGIPPETIKDSMRLGMSVPTVYVVPVERFCREMGPALGVNLAEFEFPAYFNFFVLRRKCMLVVDSFEAEKNIRKVFSETLLGPAQFRKKGSPVAYQEEDFDPSFPREAIPNFAKELKHFRMMPNGKELDLETLLEFAYFETPSEEACETKLGVPPPLSDEQKKELETSGFNDMVQPEAEAAVGKTGRRMTYHGAGKGGDKKKQQEEENDPSKKNWTYSQVKWVGAY